MITVRTSRASEWKFGASRTTRGSAAGIIRPAIRARRRVRRRLQRHRLAGAFTCTPGGSRFIATTVQAFGLNATTAWFAGTGRDRTSVPRLRPGQRPRDERPLQALDRRRRADRSRRRAWRPATPSSPRDLRCRATSSSSAIADRPDEVDEALRRAHRAAELGPGIRHVRTTEEAGDEGVLHLSRRRRSRRCARRAGAPRSRTSGSSRHRSCRPNPDGDRARRR